MILFLYVFDQYNLLIYHVSIVNSNQLAELNDAVNFMQKEKRNIVEEGNDKINANKWLSSVVQLASGTISNTTNKFSRNKSGLIQAEVYSNKLPSISSLVD
jgi:hypothetical protein